MPKPVVDKELVLRVAGNARLRLSGEEVKRFVPQLKEVLDYFSKLDKLDVSKEEPSFQPVPIANVFREDRVEGCLSQEEARANTKHRKGGYFKGPRVV